MQQLLTFWSAAVIHTINIIPFFCYEYLYICKISVTVWITKVTAESIQYYYAITITSSNYDFTIIMIIKSFDSLRSTVYQILIKIKICYHLFCILVNVCQIGCELLILLVSVVILSCLDRNNIIRTNTISGSLIA